jgi:hypothetical protein
VFLFFRVIDTVLQNLRRVRVPGEVDPRPLKVAYLLPKQAFSFAVSQSEAILSYISTTGVLGVRGGYFSLSCHCIMGIWWSGIRPECTG